jgi:hypothetical protein
MWQVDNRTPFAAERGWVRERDGAELWLVAIKCTFDVRPDGSTEVSSEQPEVLRVPEHFGEPGASSLKYEADLVLAKVTTDVLVVGHAHAPKGKPTDAMDVGFRVGPVAKSLRVFGDRVWRSSSPSAPHPFVKMPIVYERAYGGTDHKSKTPERDWEWRNPVGTGFAVAKANIDGMALPNIEDAAHLIRSWNDRPAPAGFGPIAGHWQPRIPLAGTYDDKWMKERQPLLPEDFQERYYQCAPADQQSPEFLRGGEPVVLHGLTPSGDLKFLLPRVFPRLETRFYTGERELHQPPRLHTVIIEPDFPRVSLVWHSALPCHFKVQKLERTIVTLKTLVRLGGAEESSDAA